MPAKPRFKLQAPLIREWPRHKAIADLLRLELGPPGHVSPHGVLWWSCDPADYGGSVPGARMSRGIVAGVPDLFLTYLGAAFLVEVKRDDTALSDAQRSLASAALVSGARFAVVRDPDDMLRCLDHWQIPRSRRAVLQ